MKTVTFFSTLLLSVLASFAQATTNFTVNFNNNIPGVLVTHVYWEDVPGATPKSGNGPNDTPAGTQDYSDATPIGEGFLAQLAGSTRPDSGFVLAYPMTTFRTGPEAGFVNPVTVTLTNVPADAPNVTLRLLVWSTAGGVINDWSSAIAYGMLYAASPPLPWITAVVRSACQQS